MSSAIAPFDPDKFRAALAGMKLPAGRERPAYAIENTVLVYCAGRIRPTEAENDYRCALFGIDHEYDIGWDEGAYGARCVGLSTGIHHDGVAAKQCAEQCAQWSGPFPQKWGHCPLAGGFGHGVANTAAAQTRLHVFNRQRIAECDVFLFEIGLDFDLAFGTHYEVGYADALGKPLIAFVNRGTNLADLPDYWFLTQRARIVHWSPDWAGELLRAIAAAAPA